MVDVSCLLFFFFKQKTAYEMRISDWSSDVCSSDLSESGQQPEQRDVAILASSPGAGRITIATLLAEAWDALRRRDYHVLRCLCGVAPVTRQSGKSKFVVRRLAASRRLQNAAYHWALAALQRDPRSRAKYSSLRQRGHGHARALRSVADRLLAMLCAMLRTQTLYDPDRPAKPVPAWQLRWYNPRK